LGPANISLEIQEYSVEEWYRVLAIDLDGLFYFCRTVILGIVERKSGNVINIASVMDVIPVRLQSGFTAAKAGVTNFKIQALEARNTATGAMSSGRPNRPRGVSAII
jgi:NADP-dependent 3-hydroxy acid dehydrogenase YdfG